MPPPGAAGRFLSELREGLRDGIQIVCVFQSSARSGRGGRPQNLKMRHFDTTIPGPIPSTQALRPVREVWGSPFGEHSRDGRNGHSHPNGPLPFHLELQWANREYRRADRDSFERTFREPRRSGAVEDQFHGVRCAHVRTSGPITPTSHVLIHARLGEILPVRDTNRVARLSSAYQPSARAGSIVDLMI